MKKLIRVENDFYVLQPLATKLDEWCFEMHNEISLAEDPVIYIDSKENKWYLRQLNMNCEANDSCIFKITHSTKQLEGVIKLEIGEVNNFINKCNGKELAKRYLSFLRTVETIDEKSSYSGETLRSNIEIAFSIGFIYAQREFVNDELSKQTEWSIEIDENNKITLLQTQNNNNNV